MGGFLKADKPPSPPPLPKPPEQQVNTENPDLLAERERRQRAKGTSGNIVSSLSNQVQDQDSQVRISKLLGG